jgi:TrmH family RNA methyltransferase
MIPFYKLETLPRSLQLRKIIKIFGEAEHRLGEGKELSPAEYAYFVHILELLAKDTAFPPETALVIREAETTLKIGLHSNVPGQSLLRPLNSIRHILLSEIGRSPADWDFIDPIGRLDPHKRRCFPGMRVYLEDIRAPFNVGSMFRTAESFGLEKIFLSPLCADPRHPRAERTAMGCVSVLEWERLSRNRGIETLEGPLFALETGGTKLRDFQFPAQGLMIVGSEELGVSPQALAAADASLGRLSIPTTGAKGSLNASVAFGIALHAWAEALQNL